MFDYSHDAHATVVQVAMSCRDSRYCILQGSQLGKTDGDFSPLVRYIEPFHKINASHLGQSFQVSP